MLSIMGSLLNTPRICVELKKKRMTIVNESSSEKLPKLFGGGAHHWRETIFGPRKFFVLSSVLRKFRVK
jgi:hypothetical protein